MTWAIWITGLPGSGKSSVAKAVRRKLKGNIQVLRMDSFRKILTPEPKYTIEERGLAYRAMVLIGKYLVENGVNVIFDATGHKVEYRELARKLIPNFKEVYIKCPLKVAMQREANRKQNLVMRDLYKKALDRLDGKEVDLVGEVIGVDVKYEEPKNPELVIDAVRLNANAAAEKIAKLVEDGKEKN